jgi:antitoxin (DNA-binding transcriptional repressor) of toxin-antitoxin stability system
VVITKNGRPCAVLMPVAEDTDLEIVALSQSKRFWRTFDRAVAKAEREGWTPLGEV